MVGRSNNTFIDVPLPSMLLNVTFPPSFSTVVFTIYKPNPVPVELVVAL